MCFVQSFKNFILKSAIVFQNDVIVSFFYNAVPYPWEVCYKFIAECYNVYYVDRYYVSSHLFADCRVSGGLKVLSFSTAKVLKSIDICKEIMLKVY